MPGTTHSCGLVLPLVAEVIALRQNAEISTRVFFCLIIKLHNGVQKGDEMLFDTKAVLFHEDYMALVRDEGFDCFEFVTDVRTSKVASIESGMGNFFCRRAFFSILSCHFIGGTGPAEFGNLRGEIRVLTPRI